MRSLSGQSLIFEQVLLFAIGVAVFLALFAVFTTYQIYFSSVNLENQMDEIKNIIVSDIMKLTYKGNATVSTTLNIPREISNEGYQVILTSNGLTVKSLLSDAEKFSPVYGLNETYELSGSVTSLLGRVIIYKKENKIILS